MALDGTTQKSHLVRPGQVRPFMLFLFCSRIILHYTVTTKQLRLFRSTCTDSMCGRGGVSGSAAVEGWHSKLMGRCREVGGDRWEGLELMNATLFLVSGVGKEQWVWEEAGKRAVLKQWETLCFKIKVLRLTIEHCVVLDSQWCQNPVSISGP